MMQRVYIGEEGVLLTIVSLTFYDHFLPSIHQAYGISIQLTLLLGTRESKLDQQQISQHDYLHANYKRDEAYHEAQSRQRPTRLPLGYA